jgi:hypothetical protein
MPYTMHLWKIMNFRFDYLISDDATFLIPNIKINASEKHANVGTYLPYTEMTYKHPLSGHYRRPQGGDGVTRQHHLHQPHDHPHHEPA